MSLRSQQNTTGGMSRPNLNQQQQQDNYYKSNNNNNNAMNSNDRDNRMNGGGGGSSTAAMQQQQQQASRIGESSSSRGNGGERGGEQNQAGIGTSSSSTSTPYAKAPPVTVEQSRTIARTHFDALRDWLSGENALSNGSSRSNAREKLTRLTRQQNQELSTDVYDELMRRLDANHGHGGEAYLPVRNEFHPKRNQARQKLASLPLQRFRDLASDVYFELERRYPEFAEDEVPLNVPPSPSAYSPSLPIAPRLIAESVDRRRAAGGPSPSSNGMNSPSMGGGEPPVPTKSPETDAGSELYSGGNGQSLNAVGKYGGDYENGSGSGSGNGGMGGERGMASRASESSSIGGSRFIGQYGGNGSESGGNQWDYDDKEKVKSDYEYKITLLQKRIGDLERENEDAMNRNSDSARTRELEAQVRSHRDRYEDQSLALTSLRSDYDQLQQQSSRSGSSDPSSSRLRQEIDQLSRERSESEEIINELRGEVTSLVEELREVNGKYEELLEGRHEEGKGKDALEDEVRSWRKKYEQAKTELRNVKATSQLFVGSIKSDADHMPASADGVIADVNITAFQTSIDDLLQAARSKEPSSVLPAMRLVVGAVEKIDSDVQSLDQRRLNNLPLAEQDRLQSLKSKTNATLSNLMTASKNHAMSFGVSPVSLLDAAASHLSSTIVDLVRILKIKRTTSSAPSSAQSESRAFSPPPPLPSSNSYNNKSAYSSNSAPSLNNARGISGGKGSSDSGSLNSPALRNPSFDYQQQQSQIQSQPSQSSMNSRVMSPPMPSEDGNRYQRGGGSAYSGSSNRGGDDRESAREKDSRTDNRFAPTGSSRGTSRQASFDQQSETGYGNGSGNGRENNNSRQQYNAPNSSNSQQQPLPSTRGSVLTYGSPALNQADNGDDLRNYLENQTEAIVHSIQSLLSAIRSGAQGEQLNENLTQIITIVSSICASTRGALPYAVQEEGESILRDLEENCDRLSEMQQSSSTKTFNKTTKQSMASASFSVAKGLKSLNGLLSNRREDGSEN